MRTHEVDYKASCLLDVGDGGADRDIVRQLLKITGGLKEETKNKGEFLIKNFKDFFF